MDLLPRTKRLWLGRLSIMMNVSAARPPSAPLVSTNQHDELRDEGRNSDGSELTVFHTSRRALRHACRGECRVKHDNAPQAAHEQGGKDTWTGGYVCVANNGGESGCSDWAGVAAGHTTFGRLVQSCKRSCLMALSHRCEHECTSSRPTCSKAGCLSEGLGEAGLHAYRHV